MRPVSIVAGLTLLAVLLRIRGIGHSFYGDEVFSLLRDAEVLITTTEDRFRPVFFSLLYLWKQLGFSGEAGLRALPLLFGVLQVPVAFEVGRRVAGIRGAACLALLVATSPALVEFSQELRMYSLVPLLALLQVSALLNLAEHAGEPRIARASAVACAVFGVVGVYTHFHYFIFQAGIAAVLFRYRSKIPLLVSVGILGTVALLYVPNVPNLLRFVREGASGAHLASTDLVSAVPKLVAAFVVGFNYFAVPGLGLSRAVRGSAIAANASLVVAVVIPCTLLGLRIVRLHLEHRVTEGVRLAYELCVLPIALALLLVVVTGSNFTHPKYLVFALPFALLLLTAGYLEVKGLAERMAVLMPATLVVVVALLHFNDSERCARREDWRGAVALLRPALAEGAQVIMLGRPPATDPTTRPPENLLEYYGSDVARRARFVLPVPARPGAASSPPADLLPLDSGRPIYFLWSDIAQNFLDPAGTVLGALRAELSEGRSYEEQRRQLNPRLALYQFTPPR